MFRVEAANITRFKAWAQQQSRHQMHFIDCLSYNKVRLRNTRLQNPVFPHSSSILVAFRLQ